MINWNYIGLHQSPYETHDGATKLVWSLYIKQDMPAGTVLPRYPYETRFKTRTRESVKLQFLDEAYTKKIMTPNFYMDENWWNTHMTGSNVTWTDFKTSDPILTTTTGIMLGILPPP